MAKQEFTDNSIYTTLTITEIREEAQGVKRIVFGGQDAKAIQYKPGQYLTFSKKTHHHEERRSYSITSTPVLNEPLAIGVKRVENGLFSRMLVDEVRVGDKLSTLGATGLFTLPEDIQAYKQVFFLAAGSGITPIFSLLKTVLHASPDLQVVLIYSNKTPAHAIFREELEELAAEFPERLRIEFLFSNSPDLSRARLYKDLMQAFLRQYAVAPYEQILFYLCGPTNYMRMCFYALRQEEVPDDNIRRESFSRVKVPQKVSPPDTDAHQVTLHFRNRTFQLQVQYPDNILRAAKKENIPLPYSCEAGKCGSCAAKCLKGDVWMSYNEVLTDKDLKKGLTLTCVGYPVGGDVELDIG
ncbi:ring-1,2-phenylacetyl-CoA epoxidase subunit PaaE [Pontibacter ummariensis]|uniref:Ring-1,2-phenylacetyl-CoA epoxidase subunit PaaE n=1 Tax=Pontibacter ummariensis TaxID=1610492 RepID=A0A239KYM5_9BACT|nr:ferredoxin--NADP reductase [Pontibacter ummariensis]PRY04652.1 ring-1,2-phenylacetyl-CoA epoxidase subunit PaaE [Pontibacter ummariensis]SNT23311.1 ring-1,2-phenylacetyl-CoA epoxidase subunit PaaE [Pontibacter ummariensis]